MDAQQHELKKTWGIELSDAGLLQADKKKPDSVANSIANDVSLQTDSNRKSVGGVYACDACGAEYTARTVWQRYCPTCSQERRKGILRRKKETIE